MPDHPEATAQSISDAIVRPPRPPTPPGRLDPLGLRAQRGLADRRYTCSAGPRGHRPRHLPLARALEGAPFPLLLPPRLVDRARLTLASHTHSPPKVAASLAARSSPVRSPSTGARSVQQDLADPSPTRSSRPAEAAWAAVQSVRRDESNTEKDLHSLHVRAVSLDPACRSDLVLVPADLVLVRPLSQCYFLNFGNADIPVLYSVQRLRDGRSYSTRSVLATQQGVPIFTLTCSFCLPEPKQPVRALPLPHWPLRWHRTEEDKAQRKDLGDSIPEPEDCDATEEVMLKALAAGKNLPKKLQDLCVLLLLARLEDEHQTLTAVLPAASSAKPRSAGSRRSSCATPTGASLPTHSLAASGELTSLLYLAGAKQGSSSASSGPPRSSASSLVFPSPPAPAPSRLADSLLSVRRQLYWFRSRAPVRADPDFQKVRPSRSTLSCSSGSCLPSLLPRAVRPRLRVRPQLHRHGCARDRARVVDQAEARHACGAFALPPSLSPPRRRQGIRADT